MTSDRVRRLLLGFGAAGPVVFVVGYTVNGAALPGYDSRRHTISTLSLGRCGWVQDANFMVYGASTLCLAEGLRRSEAVTKAGAVLLRVAGTSLVLVGCFRSDPILGFPPEAPAVETRRGAVHNAASLVVFAALSAAAMTGAPRSARSWRRFSLATGALTLAALGGFFASVAAGEESAPAGLLERSTTLFVGAWSLASAMRAWA